MSITPSVKYTLKYVYLNVDPIDITNKGKNISLNLISLLLTTLIKFGLHGTLTFLLYFHSEFEAKSFRKREIFFIY